MSLQPDLPETPDEDVPEGLNLTREEWNKLFAIGRTLMAMRTDEPGTCGFGNFVRSQGMIKELDLPEETL